MPMTLPPHQIQGTIDTGIVMKRISAINIDLYANESRYVLIELQTGGDVVWPGQSM
jgi:hypothetical protein